MKTWVIPDVHGCSATLKSLVETLICPNQDDTIIFLGDYVDRGPDSKGVIEYVQHLSSVLAHVITLKGNHEDYIHKVIQEAKEPTLLMKMGFRGILCREWMFHGGNTFLSSYGVKRASELPEDICNWLENLQYYHIYKSFLIVHAGFNFSAENIFEDSNAMLWVRDYTIDHEKLAGRRIIHGHVPMSLEFIHQSLENPDFGFIDLDNGVYMTDKPGYGNLMALELNSMELLIQPNLDM